MRTAKNSISYLILLISLFTSCKAIAQDWKWAFGGSGINQNTRLLGTDRFNNSYFAVFYADSLTVGGQTYYHKQWNYVYNCLLVKLDNQGNLLKQIDFYSPAPAHSSMADIKLVTDSLGNVYVGGGFEVRVFIGDTVINHLPLPYYEGPATYLAKFDSNLDIKWAKVMGCEHYVYFDNIVMRNGYFTYSVNPQSWASPNPTILYCFGEDTLYFSKNQDNNVYFNLDLDGKILSHYTIHANDAYMNDEIITENNHRYVIGFTYDSLYIDDELVFIPQSYYDYYFLHFDNHDSLIEVSTVNLPIKNAHLNISGINTENELFFWIKSYAGLTIGDSTIPYLKPGSFIIGKLNTERNIDWYENVGGSSNQQNLIMKPFHDTLFASFEFFWDLSLLDTAFYNNSVIPENRILSFDSNGKLINAYKTKASAEIQSIGIGFDNCGNIMFSGNYRGKLIFGNDTLTANDYSGPKGIFIAYMRNAVKDIDIGPDTTVCEQFLIFGPAGFDHYSWNSGIGYEKDLLVTETGIYKLTAWTDKCCFMEDSIHVTIQPFPLCNLGSDTTLKQSHSLLLSLPSGYDKYLWSTNAETNSIVLEGSLFTAGFHTFWCMVTNNGCTSTDTINIEVIKDNGIKETPEIEIRIRPNPFKDKFTISCEKPIAYVEILDYSGKLLTAFHTAQDISQPLHITLPSPAKRLLILKIKTNDGCYYRKVIQIPVGN